MKYEEITSILCFLPGIKAVLKAVFDIIITHCSALNNLAIADVVDVQEATLTYGSC